jgi:hypothetical protein
MFCRAVAGREQYPETYTLELDPDATIDFSKIGDGTLTIVERLEMKKKRAMGGNLLDDKF